MCIRDRHMSKAAACARARSLRLALQQGASLSSRQKSLEAALHALHLREQRHTQLLAVHAQAVLDPQCTQLRHEMSARASLLVKKRDLTSSSLAQLQQECTDEIENNLRRFLISVGAAHVSRACEAAEAEGRQLSREQLGDMAAAAHKQATHCTMGELGRLQSKLSKFEVYAVSLQQEAADVPVPPLTRTQLLQARELILRSTAQCTQQIQVCTQNKVQACPHSATEEECRWQLLRLQMISLSATKAQFRITQGKPPNQDALSTTALKSHELGTKWTKAELDSLLSKLQLVQADVQRVCAELAQMMALFSADSSSFSFEELCKAFKDCVAVLQQQKKSVKLNKLEAQLKELSKQVNAEEERLGSLSAGDIQAAILQLEQRIAQFGVENLEQRAFLEKSQAQLLTPKEEALLKSLPQLKEELQTLEKDIQGHVVNGNGTESDDRTKKKKKKKPAFQIHDAVAICCLLYTSPSPRDRTRSRMPSSA
eukprot:TRINITY_DN4054_c0_g1_i2.p1 TRINITY_DN4054_c0_g1~~TRINITY_DN4054_c0_g1_i2.p1  ORF type:complete len:484 (+),score=163.74 TRINITY_DN4054_c0_g1_i2:104-1555(+)